MPNISQMAMQILRGEVMHPGSVQHMGSHVPVAGNWSPKKEGMQEQEGPCSL